MDVEIDESARACGIKEAAAESASHIDTSERGSTSCTAWTSIVTVSADCDGVFGNGDGEAELVALSREVGFDSGKRNDVPTDDVDKEKVDSA